MGLTTSARFFHHMLFKKQTYIHVSHILGNFVNVANKLFFRPFNLIVFHPQMLEAVITGVSLNRLYWGLFTRTVTHVRQVYIV